VIPVGSNIPVTEVARLICRNTYRAWLVQSCLVCAGLIFPAHAQTSASAVVSAANFQSTIAPNSLATVFGQGLAKSVTTAQLDSSGQLPTAIDGSSVSVLGTLARLVYVSPTQINFVVPAGTPAGLVTVLINTPLSSQPVSVTTTVALIAPGLFTIPCQRPDRGAVLNGITYSLEPFQAVTTANPGTDKRTRLSIFGTGIRYAGNPSRDPSQSNVASSVQVEATDTLGIVRKLVVEYAGAAPNFAGLDQINVIAPTDLEGAGLVRLRIVSGTSASNTVSIVLSQTLAAGIFANPNFSILTVAGSGATGNSGDQGKAVQAQLQNPSAVAIDSHHNLYIADEASHVVRRVSPEGVITTFAGTGAAGSNGDNGLANEAQLRRPVALALDAAGNLYIADADDHKIRKVSTNGTISTFAGNGAAEFSGDNGPATAAQLSSPSGVAVNAYGTVYIADTGNNRVRKVTGDGLISTFAGTGVAGSAGDGNAAYFAQLNGPDSLAVGVDGTVYVADEGNLRVRRIAPDGTIRTVAGGGNLDLGAASSTQDPASTSVLLQSPIRLSIDNDQRMFISDTQNSRIRVMDAQCGLGLAAGTGTAGFSGDGGPALSAQLNRPMGLAPDETGDVYFADANNHRARVLFAGNCSSPSVILFDPPAAISGMPVNATVRLSCPVSADTVLMLSVDNAGLQLPVSVTVGAGQTTATFSFVAPPVSAETSLHITASNSQITATGTIVISPAAALGIASLTLSPPVQTGGLTLTGTLTLTAPAPSGGLMVLLISDNGAAHVLGAITVPGGQLTTEFLVVTSQVTQRVVIDITATLATQSLTASATLLPQDQAPIASLTLSPSSLIGGMQNSVGTVTLTSPAGNAGVKVLLQSNNGAAAVPVSITIPAGQMSATFEISTSPVTTITTATITASSANTVTANLTVNPGSGGPGGSGGNLAGLSISPASVVGGNSATGTVTLNAPAPSGGTQVTLSSNNGAASIPSSVLVPAGQTSATFPVTTTSVSATAQITITATSGNTLSAMLTVTSSSGGGGGSSGMILSFTIVPPTVIGGTPAIGTVTLTQPAPAGGVTVSLSSNSSVASVPSSIIVLAGQTSASFSIVTVPVQATATVTITASAANTVAQGLIVTPVTGGSSVSLSSLTIFPSTVIGGLPSTGTVTLTGPAPAGGIMVLLSSNSLNATVQPSVVISAGQTSASFPIATLPVLSSTTATITATASNSVSAGLTLNPVAGGGNPTLLSLTISPSTVIGGVPAMGTVTLSAPAPGGGVTVSLSSNSLNATVQPTVLVLSGQTSASFPIVTLAVLATTTATISASASNTVTADLTLNAAVGGGGTPVLASLDLSASAVVGGVATMGTVTLTAPAPMDGVLVSLSSDSLIATVPPSVLVLSGHTQASFVVATVPVLISTPVTISATAGASFSSMLAVHP